MIITIGQILDASNNVLNGFNGEVFFTLLTQWVLNGDVNNTCKKGRRQILGKMLTSIIVAIKRKLKNCKSKCLSNVAVFEVICTSNTAQITSNTATLIDVFAPTVTFILPVDLRHGSARSCTFVTNSQSSINSYRLVSDESDDLGFGKIALF